MEFNAVEASQITKIGPLENGHAQSVDNSQSVCLTLDYIITMTLIWQGSQNTVVNAR